MARVRSAESRHATAIFECRKNLTQESAQSVRGRRSKKSANCIQMCARRGALCYGPFSIDGALIATHGCTDWPHSRASLYCSSSFTLQSEGVAVGCPRCPFRQPLKSPCLSSFRVFIYASKLMLPKGKSLNQSCQHENVFMAFYGKGDNI